MLYQKDNILNNEAALVRECIAGNRSMQNLLYNAYAPGMFVVCQRYCKSRADAEEVLQEGFIKVFTNLHQFKFRGSLEGWIKRIMINCALESLRKKHKLYPILNIENDSVYELYDDDLIFSNLNAKELIEMIQELPAMCRFVFNLYVFEGFKHKEIAEILKISEGTSKSHLFDARNILQQRLKVYTPLVKNKI